MRTCSAPSRGEAWLNAARIMHTAKGRVYNMIVEIDHPATAKPIARAIEARVDTFLKEHDAQPIHTVAETIFPATEYRQGGLKQVYAYPKTIFPQIKSAPGNTRGTYAQRLVERTMSDGKSFNPLETAIEKLRGQLSRSGPQRAIYELDLTVEALELKFYESELDHGNPRGGQCLSHISLKLGENRELYLTALYRYQFFIQKALGNFKGLARLQACIARELGIPIGPLVCHATLAILEDNALGAPWKRADVDDLLRECEQLAQDATPQVEAL